MKDHLTDRPICLDPIAPPSEHGGTHPGKSGGLSLGGKMRIDHFNTAVRCLRVLWQQIAFDVMGGDENMVMSADEVRDIVWDHAGPFMAGWPSDMDKWNLLPTEKKTRLIRTAFPDGSYYTG